MAPSYLTPEGYERLKKELEYLQTVKRREVAERLREAMEGGGDLIDNAEYEAAKTEQAFVEGRIAELTQMLANARVIVAEKHNVVELGARVTIQEEGYEPETFIIVGPVEADPRNGRISHESPIGKALLGHKAGDTVKVKAPDGEYTVRVLKVE